MVKNILFTRCELPFLFIDINSTFTVHLYMLYLHLSYMYMCEALYKNYKLHFVIEIVINTVRKKLSLVASILHFYSILEKICIVSLSLTNCLQNTIRKRKGKKQQQPILFHSCPLLVSHAACDKKALAQPIISLVLRAIGQPFSCTLQEYLSCIFIVDRSCIERKIRRTKSTTELLFI